MGLLLKANFLVNKYIAQNWSEENVSEELHVEFKVKITRLSLPLSHTQLSEMPAIIFMIYYVRNFVARTAEQSETISGWRSDGNSVFAKGKGGVCGIALGSTNKWLGIFSAFFCVPW